MSQVSSLIRRVIEDSQVIAIVRLARAPIEIAQALTEGGIVVAEISLTSDDAVSLIRRWRRSGPEELTLGAGTVLTPKQAATAIDAGAAFLVAPNFDERVQRVADEADLLYIPGFLTPTEAIRAREGGAELLKLFPARSLGEQYLTDLLAPLPGLKVVATGGMSVANARAFIDAGATAVAAGASVVSAGKSFGEIRRAAQAICDAVSAKSPKSSVQRSYTYEQPPRASRP